MKELDELLLNKKIEWYKNTFSVRNIMNEKKYNAKLFIQGRINRRYKSACIECNTLEVDHLFTASKLYNDEKIDLIKIAFALSVEAGSFEGIVLNEYFKKYNSRVAIVSLAESYLGEDNFDSYCIYAAKRDLYEEIDDREVIDLCTQKMDDIIFRWIDEMKSHAMVYYDRKYADGIVFENYDAMYAWLVETEKEKYPLSPMNYQFPEKMYDRERFVSYCNYHTIDEIENLQNEQKIAEYRELLKTHVENFIEQTISEKGKISELELMSFLCEKPIGMSASKVDAYLLGWLLDNINKEKLRLSDGKYKTIMTSDAMIDLAIKMEKFIYRRSETYHEYYFVKKDPMEEELIDTLSDIFGFDRLSCKSVEDICSLLRDRQEAYVGPLWTLQCQEQFSENAQKFFALIRDFSNINPYYKNDSYEICRELWELLKQDEKLTFNIKKMIEEELEHAYKNFLKQECQLSEEQVLKTIHILNSDSLYTLSWKWMWDKDTLKQVIHGLQ